MSEPKLADTTGQISKRKFASLVGISVPRFCRLEKMTGAPTVRDEGHLDEWKAFSDRMTSAASRDGTNQHNAPPSTPAILNAKERLQEAKAAKAEMEVELTRGKYIAVEFFERRIAELIFELCSGGARRFVHELPEKEGGQSVEFIRTKNTEAWDDLMREMRSGAARLKKDGVAEVQAKMTRAMA